MKAKLFLSAAIIMSISSAGAQTIRQHARHQQARIAQGVKSGELTKAETVNLERKENAVRKEVKIAKADGTVTAAERKDIRQDQRQTSRAIYRKKHNGRERN